MADTTNTASTLSILIDIRARLDELAKARSELQATKRDGEGLTNFFSQGLGIGSGIELVRRGVDFFRAAIVSAITSSSSLAAEVERADKRLGMSASGYQTLAKEARESQTDFQELLAGLNAYRSKLGEALIDSSQGSAFRQIGVDVKALASLPLEEQAEKVAVGLGHIADANVRARIQQELFGRNAAAMTPVLERLRVEGLEPLRRSAKEAGAILGDDTAEALNRAGTAAEDAQRRLTVALAPINLQLLQAKTGLANFLARNSGSISSGVEAGFAASIAASLDKGLVKAAEYLEKSGGWRAAFTNFGKTLAGPIGVGIVAFLGAYIIKEIERAKISANERSSAFDEKSYRFSADIIKKELPAVQSSDDVRSLYNKAVVEYQKLVIERRKAIPFAKTDEDNERIASMDNEMNALGRLIPLIQSKGAAYVKANQASLAGEDELFRAQYSLALAEINWANDQKSVQLTDEEKRAEEIEFLKFKAATLQKIAELTEKTPLKVGENPDDRKMRLLKLKGQARAADYELLDAQTPLSDYESRQRGFDTFASGKNANGGDQLSAGEGAAAGAMDYVSSLGSQGEQVAAALNSSIGTAVSGISQGIYGWITGTMSFGEALRNIGGTILQTFIQTIIQMGVQWMVTQTLMKLGLISTHAVGEGLRAQRIAGATAEGAATEAAMAPAAATASISSFGLAAAIGIAALLAVMAAFGGFATGGHFQDRPTGFVTGPGTGTSDSILARVSNKEWIAPEWMVQDPVYGGMIDTLESARKGTPGFRGGGLFGFLTSSLVHGGVPKKMLLPQVNRFFEDYNLINGRKTYGATDASSSSYDYASGKWIQDTAADRYVVTGQNSAGGSSVATTAAGAAEAADSARAQSAVATTESGRPIQVVFLDRTDRSMVEQLKRDPLAEQYFVDLMYQNRAVLGRKI